MPFDVLIALISFAFVTSMTPGPNNIMVLASGVNFGFRRTVPHMLGIIFGFQILLLCIGVGLGQLLERAPVVFIALKFAGGSYLLYLAYKIATSGPVANTRGDGRPLSVIGAAAFQWVNPKAWVVSLTSIATYTNLEHYQTSLAIVVLTMLAASLVSVTTWTAFGIGLSTFLSNPKVLRVFNITMALLLVASLWPMLR